MVRVVGLVVARVVMVVLLVLLLEMVAHHLGTPLLETEVVLL
jgi:hypothetical protein